MGIGRSKNSNSTAKMILKSNKSFGEVFIPQSRFKGMD